MTKMKEFALWVSGFAGANAVYHYIFGGYFWAAVTFLVAIMMFMIYVEARPK